MYTFKSNLRFVAVGAWSRQVYTAIDFDPGVLEAAFIDFDLGDIAPNATRIK